MRYVGLLRAVNVGGKHKITMAQLRAALEAVGLEYVRTYIQSGNVVFESQEAAAVLQAEIEGLIHHRFGFHTDVILRTITEFDDLIDHCPFLNPSHASTARGGLAGAFFAKPPSPEMMAALGDYAVDGEQYQVRGRDLYLLLPRGTARSKLVARLQKLGPATVRNWNTIHKLHALAHDR